MMHICVMSSHKPVRIYMVGLILGINTLYRLFCVFKLFPMVDKGLTLSFQSPDLTFPSHLLVLEKAKTGYLLAYNGIQWSGFILVVMTLLMKCLKGWHSTLLIKLGPSGDTYVCKYRPIPETLKAIVSCFWSLVA